PPAERERERQDLDRKAAAAAESVDELLGGHEDDLTPRGSRDDALAHQGGAVAFDEVEVGVNLVRTVDGEVDVSLDPHEIDAELAGQVGRFVGRRDTARP